MDKRELTFETSEGDTIKLRRWSMKKFNTLFEKFEDLVRAVFRVMYGLAELKGDDDKDVSPDDLEKTVAGIMTVFQQSRAKIEFIISESIVDPPKDFDVGELLPEDYFDLLDQIIRIFSRRSDDRSKRPQIRVQASDQIRISLPKTVRFDVVRHTRLLSHQL